MPGRKRVPGEVDAAKVIDPKELNYLRDRMRKAVDAIVSCSTFVHPSMTYGELRTNFSMLRPIWAEALALRSRVEGLVVGMGSGIPEGDKVDLERRMALSLELHGIEPYALEELADDLAVQAENRLAVLKRGRPRRKT